MVILGYRKIFKCRKCSKKWVNKENVPDVCPRCGDILIGRSLMVTPYYDVVIARLTTKGWEELNND